MAETAEPIQRALISVSNKTGLVEFCHSLTEEFKVEIISTGGTLKTLEEANISALEISQFTNFPEMMDGRVKTLHPKVHAGILARRDQDQKVMKECKGNQTLASQILGLNRGTLRTKLKDYNLI